MRGHISGLVVDVVFQKREEPLPPETTRKSKENGRGVPTGFTVLRNQMSNNETYDRIEAVAKNALALVFRSSHQANVSSGVCLKRRTTLRDPTIQCTDGTVSIDHRKTDSKPKDPNERIKLAQETIVVKSKSFPKTPKLLSRRQSSVPSFCWSVRRLKEKHSGRRIVLCIMRLTG